MQKILVLGGSGFIGHHVCEALERAGLYATVPTRRLPARSVQMLPRVTVVRADVHDPAQLSALVRGHDAVINLVAILHGTAQSFDHVHVQLPRLLAQACVDQGVRRLVHMSALGVDVNGPSMYLRSKAQGDAVLQDMAARHGLQLTATASPGPCGAPGLCPGPVPTGVGARRGPSLGPCLAVAHQPRPAL
jgi:NADH dehydrogenase